MAAADITTEELVPYERARELATQAVQPLDIEPVGLLDALGRPSVETLRATGDLTPFARSAMDGYAVRAADTGPAGRLAIAGRVNAGDAPAVHRPRTATAISTGAPLPDGADAVTPWEDVEVIDGAIRFDAGVAAGENVFPPGEDARCGDVLAPADRTLHAGTLALLAAAGYATVRVRRRPRVAILCTGDELVEPGQPLRLGQVCDSNGVLLEALLRVAGARVVQRRRCADEPACTRRALDEAARLADLVITTGGASNGKRDAVKPAIDALGGAFLFRSVALRPAKPAALARLGATPVLVLPGNPSAAFVGYQLFGKRILDGFAGRAVADPVAAALSGTIHAKPHRTSAILVSVCRTAAGLAAQVLANQCSSLVANAARANGVAIVPPGTAVLTDGTALPVELNDCPD